MDDFLAHLPVPDVNYPVSIPDRFMGMGYLNNCLAFFLIYKVTVQTLNEYGEEIILTGENEMAKCLCHELDHLDGIVFIDKVFEVMVKELPV